MNDSRGATARNSVSIEFKRQILRVVVALTLLSLFIFLVTLTSSYWIIVTYPAGFFSRRQNMFVARGTHGIVRQCLFGASTKDSMLENKCDYHRYKLQNESMAAEQALTGMIRTMQSFSVIYVLLVTITCICGLYSIHDYRYTYKRLTGMIYILTAASLVVCIEVLSNIVRYPKQHLPDSHPDGTTYSYGTCYVIAWLIFSQLLISSLIFFACSKKRKSALDEATEEEASANRPVDLRRSFK